MKHQIIVFEHALKEGIGKDAISGAAGLGALAAGVTGIAGMIEAIIVRKRIFKNRLAYELKVNKVDPSSPQAENIKKQLKKKMAKEVLATGLLGATVGGVAGAAAGGVSGAVPHLISNAIDSTYKKK